VRLLFIWTTVFGRLFAVYPCLHDRVVSMFPTLFFPFNPLPRPYIGASAPFARRQHCSGANYPARSSHFSGGKATGNGCGQEQYSLDMAVFYFVFQLGNRITSPDRSRTSHSLHHLRRALNFCGLGFVSARPPRWLPTTQISCAGPGISQGQLFPAIKRRQQLVHR
jgi:hypothetical protein